MGVFKLKSTIKGARKNRQNLEIYLLETNVSGKGTEAPPAHHQAVLPDNSSAVSAGSAVCGVIFVLFPLSPHSSRRFLLNIPLARAGAIGTGM